jgi:hypothetical protein
MLYKRILAIREKAPDPIVQVRDPRAAVLRGQEVQGLLHQLLLLLVGLDGEELELLGSGAGVLQSRSWSISDCGAS